MNTVSAKERWSSLKKMTAQGRFKNGQSQAAGMDSESDLLDWRVRQLESWTKKGSFSLGRGKSKGTLMDLLDDDSATRDALPGQIPSCGPSSMRQCPSLEQEPSIEEGDEHQETFPPGVFPMPAEAESLASPPSNSSEYARSSSRDTVLHDDKNSFGDDIPVDLIANKSEGSREASIISWTSKACKLQPPVTQGGVDTQSATNQIGPAKLGSLNDAKTPLAQASMLSHMASDPSLLRAPSNGVMTMSRTASNHSAASSTRLATGIKTFFTRCLTRLA